MNKEDTMFDLIAKWKISGLTPSEYSRHHDITMRSFYYWRKKYNLKVANTNAAKINDNAVSFIELDASLLDKTIENKVQIEMELPNGIRIKIY